MLPETAISLQGAEFAYPDMQQVLHEVNLEVKQGERIALIGANGSGKSTLAKLCNALLTPTQGACFVYGMDTADEKHTMDIRRHVALVFQNPDDQIVASIVEEDVAFAPENLGLDQAEIRRRVDWALEATGLTDKRRAPAYALSGGQKQRLALAGALAMEPACLILDEATAMLDPEGREEFLALLGDLSARRITLIHITHDMREAADADRVIVLCDGTVAWNGGAKEFFSADYERWGFDVPSEIVLHKALCERGLLPPGTLPRVDDMIENIIERKYAYHC